jgi:hypothetical protein
MGSLPGTVVTVFCAHIPALNLGTAILKSATAGWQKERQAANTMAAPAIVGLLIELIDVSD